MDLFGGQLCIWHLCQIPTFQCGILIHSPLATFPADPTDQMRVCGQRHLPALLEFLKDKGKINPRHKQHLCAWEIQRPFEMPLLHTQPLLVRIILTPKMPRKCPISIRPKRVFIQHPLARIHTSGYWQKICIYAVSSSQIPGSLSVTDSVALQPLCPNHAFQTRGDAPGGATGSIHLEKGWSIAG